MSETYFTSILNSVPFNNEVFKCTIVCAMMNYRSDRPGPMFIWPSTNCSNTLPLQVHLDDPIRVCTLLPTSACKEEQRESGNHKLDKLFHNLWKHYFCGQCINMFVLSSLQPQTLQLDFLMKILPNYHHLKKTVKAGHNAS